MATTKKKPKVKVSGEASCSMIASKEMPCPLCGVTIPAWHQHECSVVYGKGQP